jgi:hypothetical protein
MHYYIVAFLAIMAYLYPHLSGSVLTQALGQNRDNNLRLMVFTEGAFDAQGWHVGSVRAKKIAPAWSNGSSLNLTDGDHTVTMRATDSAGNQRETSQQIRIDSLAPVSSFAAVSGPVSGVASFSGVSVDAVSGVAQVEVSLDGGSTWQPATYVNGTWTFPYDSTQRPDGNYNIQVRATDNAGHTEAAVALKIVVNNAAPQVSISESWWIWESGQLTVQPGIVALENIVLKISCGSLPDATLTFNDLDKLPGSFTWDRRCGDGTLAAPGEYPATLTACNIYGKCDSETGIIRVPEGQATPTLTALPTQMLSAPATRIRPTPTPTQVIIVPPPAPPAHPAPIPESLALWLLPMAAPIGMMLAMGVSYSRDPPSASDPPSEEHSEKGCR